MKFFHVPKFLTGLLLFALCFAFAACEQSQLRKAAAASDRIAGLVSTSIEVKQKLATAGVISREEELKITNALVEINDAAANFNSKARTYKISDPVQRSELLKILEDATQSLAELTESTQAIRDPKARDKLIATFTGINEAVKTISEILRE